MNKKSTLLLVFFFGMPILLSAQNACIDTFTNVSLYHPFFKYIDGKIASPLLDYDSATFYLANQILIKKDKDNQLIWKKGINKIIDTRFITNDNNILAIFNYEANGPENGDRGFAKINSNGNLLWAKKIKRNGNFNASAFINKAIKGKNDDIIFSSSTNINSGVSLIVLDNNANNIKLNKTYSLNFINGEYIKGFNNTSDNNNIYISLLIEKVQPVPYIITNYLLFLKIDYSSGNVISKSYYSFNDQIILNSPSRSVLYKGQFSDYFNFKITGNNLLTMAGRKGVSTFDNNRYYTIKLDTNFNIVNEHIFKYPDDINFVYSGDPTTLPDINKNGSVLFANIQDSSIIPFSTNNCYFFSVNDNLDTTTQQKQVMTETGLNSKGFRYNVVPYLKNNNEGEIIYHTDLSQNDSVLHIVRISKGIKPNDCMGNTSNLLVVETPSFTQLAPPLINIIPSDAITLAPYNLTSKDEPLEERNFCTQISICDTIKIKGDSVYCLSKPNASFTVYKNPLCIRKIKWQIDTTAIKIISEPNDSIINVQFIKPFHGYIRAAFEGCVLKDSFYVDVYPLIAPLFLGKDTTFCPGKSITLNAGPGFKTYKWQDNSISNTFSVSKPGTYSVQTTDSCDNIYNDTIIVKPLDVTLNFTYPNTLCLNDTAIIALDSKLLNYLWSPADAAIKQNNVLKLFPKSSSLFTISAAPFSGCTISDTLFVKVEVCPEYVYIPTAFTPNNDGLNDIFKPIVSGHVEEYKFSVYNRYGQQIFSSQKINEGWDGTIKGKPQDTGTFIWTCSYKFRDKKNEFKKGTMVLIR